MRPQPAIKISKREKHAAATHINMLNASLFFFPHRCCSYTSIGGCCIILLSDGQLIITLVVEVPGLFFCIMAVPKNILETPMHSLTNLWISASCVLRSWVNHCVYCPAIHGATLVSHTRVPIIVVIAEEEVAAEKEMRHPEKYPYCAHEIMVDSNEGHATV